MRMLTLAALLISTGALTAQMPIAPAISVVKPVIKDAEITWVETKTVKVLVPVTKTMIVDGKEVTVTVYQAELSSKQMTKAFKLENCRAWDSSGLEVKIDAMNLENSIKKAAGVVVVQGQQLPDDFAKMFKEGTLVIEVMK